jgi:ABC-2 type transport system ATP-binding protein
VRPATKGALTRRPGQAGARPRPYPGDVTAPALEVVGLEKRYSGRAVVDDLSLAVRPGTVLALLGPNGAGKTTTVEICQGFRTPDAGEVRVLGLSPVDPALRPRVGVMPQSGGAYPGLRCAEMLRLVASYAAHPLDPDDLLERLGLVEVSRTPYRRLSGGQQQRLSLALAVVGRPELVFLDEPTAGLDPQARHATWELVEALRRDGVSVVLTTHLMDEAERLADDVVVVDHGRVVGAGTVGQLTSTGAVGQLRFRSTPGLDLDSLVAALPPGCSATEDPAGQYLVEGPHGGPIDPRLLADVTAWCAAHDAMAADLRVETRTLEDVFLELTGRGLRA